MVIDRRDDEGQIDNMVEPSNDGESRIKNQFYD